MHERAHRFVVQKLVFRNVSGTPSSELIIAGFLNKMEEFTLHIKRPSSVTDPPPPKEKPSEEEEEEPPRKKAAKVKKKRPERNEEGPSSRKRPKHISAKTYSRFHLSATDLAERGDEPVAAVEEAKKDEKKEVRQSKFGELGLSERLAEACGRAGFVEPTAVQRGAIATLKRHREVLVVAPTGSGKTLAYALPVLDSLKGRTRDGGVGAVIVAPTRELCQQICGATTTIGRLFDVGIVAGAITGGERRKSEKARLRKGLVILCATPGRLLDHLKSTSALTVDDINWFVLDEVDRLLDLGFGPQIDDIANRLELTRRKDAMSGGIVLVTATVDAKLKDLAKRHLGADYTTVIGGDCGDCDTQQQQQEDVVVDDTRVQLPSTLSLEYVVITLKLRLAALAALCTHRRSAKTLIFVSTCAGAEFHHKLAEVTTLLGNGSQRRKVYRLHGDLEKEDRKTAYDSFCKSENGVLFATDVAARGLDFDKAQVDWVLHLDCPRDVASFVHRSGRAARAGRQGLATLCLLPSEKDAYLDALDKRHCPKPMRISVPKIAGIFETDADAAMIQKSFQTATLDDAELLHRARDAFTAHLRAYASKKNTDLNFHVRKLHLGHAAKAFALTENPRQIARRRSDEHRRIDKKNKHTMPAKHITKGSFKPTTLYVTTKDNAGANVDKHPRNLRPINQRPP